MARIKIKDLPKDMKISEEELKNITGGAGSILLNRTYGGMPSISRGDLLIKPKGEPYTIDINDKLPHQLY